MKKIVRLALCDRKNHPELPSKSIFPDGFFTGSESYFNYRRMYLQIHFVLHKYNGSNASINLYVTGLSQALGAVINYCMCRGISLTLMHWDKEMKLYREQLMNIIDRTDTSMDESFEEDIDYLLSSCNKSEGFSQGVYW